MSAQNSHELARALNTIFGGATAEQRIMGMTDDELDVQLAKMALAEPVMYQMLFVAFSSKDVVKTEHKAALRIQAGFARLAGRNSEEMVKRGGDDGLGGHFLGV